MVTITNLGMPTVSASGANIGIDSTAKPDDDGTIKPRKKKITNRTIINNGPVSYTHLTLPTSDLV